MHAYTFPHTFTDPADDIKWWAADEGLNYNAGSRPYTDIVRAELTNRDLSNPAILDLDGWITVTIELDGVLDISNPGTPRGAECTALGRCPSIRFTISLTEFESRTGPVETWGFNYNDGVWEKIYYYPGTRFGVSGSEADQYMQTPQGTRTDTFTFRIKSRYDIQLRGFTDHTISIEMIDGTGRCGTGIAETGGGNFLLGTDEISSSLRHPLNFYGPCTTLTQTGERPSGSRFRP